MAGGVSAGEIDFIARNERVEQLADIVMRRTTLAISGALTKANLAEIAEAAGAALGWTRERREAELAAAADALARLHRVRLV